MDENCKSGCHEVEDCQHIGQTQTQTQTQKGFIRSEYITILHHIYLTFKSYGSGRLPLRQLVAGDMGATLINYFYIYILLIFITQVLLLP